MIHHTVSSVSIFATDNYKMFTMVNGNRSINPKKVNAIIAEIEAGNDMLRYYPIQVQVKGEKLAILDGQHRFFICKKLKRQVHYITITEEKSMKDIAVINSNVEKWKNSDFINCYVTQGNENYIQMKNFLEKYELPLGVTMKLLLNGNPGNQEGTDTKLRS